jgi:hypothetical protein
LCFSISPPALTAAAGRRSASRFFDAAMLRAEPSAVQRELSGFVTFVAFEFFARAVGTVQFDRDHVAERRLWC